MTSLQNSVQPAAQAAYSWLKDTITSLPWDEEAFLSENVVAEASGTSRTPVREALLRLEAEGLLRRVRYKGAYIPSLSGTDIDSMMEARQVIEDWAVRKATRWGHPVDRLEKLLSKQEEIRSDSVEFIRYDIDFHKDIVLAAGNPVLAGVYDSLRHKQLRMGVRAVLGSDGRTDDVLLEHRSIVEAIRSGDPDLAAAAINSHLSSTVTALKSREVRMAGGKF